MSKQNYVTKIHFDEVIEKIDKKLNVVTEKLDWLIGRYQAHEEEHTLLNNTVSEHSDNLEIINEKLGVTL